MKDRSHRADESDPALIRLHPSERRALQTFCERHGDITAVVLLETTLETLCRAVAGCPLQITTRARLLKMLVTANRTFDRGTGFDLRERIV